MKKTKVQAQQPQALCGQFGRVMRSGAEGEICRFLSTPDGLRFARCGKSLLPAISGVLDVFDIGLDAMRRLTLQKGVAANRALRAVLARSPRITSLVLSNRTWVSSETLLCLTCDFERLESLGLHNCFQLAYPDICDIVNCCPRLRTLDLSARTLNPLQVACIGACPSVRTICLNYTTLHRSACRDTGSEFPDLATVLEGFARIKLYDRHWHPGLKFRCDADALRTRGPAKCGGCESRDVSLNSRYASVCGDGTSFFHCHDCGKYFSQCSRFDPPLADAEILKEETLDLQVLIPHVRHISWANIRSYPRIIARVREAAPDLELAFRTDLERWTCAPEELDARVLELREAWNEMHSDEESIEMDVPHFAPLWADSDGESPEGRGRVRGLVLRIQRCE